MTLAAVQMLTRVMDSMIAGRVADAKDRLAVAEAIGRFFDKGIPLESSLGVSGDWRKRANAEIATQAIRDAAASIPGFGVPGNGRLVARELSARLDRYRAGTFRIDQRTGDVPEDRQKLYAILDATSGRLPCGSTIRAALSAAGQRKPLELGQ